jgi:hypothetical protein
MRARRERQPCDGTERIFWTWNVYCTNDQYMKNAATEPTQAPALPNFVQTLLQLFEGPLRGVRFPQADADALAASVALYQEAQLGVLSAEAALRSACTLRTERDTELARVSQRVLAYARVYAQDNPELLALIPGGKGLNKAPRRAKGNDATAVVASDDQGELDLGEVALGMDETAATPIPRGVRGRPRRAQVDEAAAAE